MRIDRYSLLERIGDGPFSCVFKAEDTLQRGRIVAIKIWKVPHQNRDKYHTFIQNIQPLVTLRHGHILPLFKVAMESNSPYFVIQYAAGGTLSDQQQKYPQRRLPGCQVPHA